MAATSPREVATPAGPARVQVRLPEGGARAARGTVLLGHGAGGGVEAVDLQRVAAGSCADGWAVALVEQPWRVAGKRVAAPPPRLDEAWAAVVEAMRRGRGALPGPFVFGGRSAGARVACRLAGPLGAGGVIALAFPLHPPGRPEKSRIAELVGALTAGVPVLVVQGERDPFGGPAEVQDAIVAALPGPARTGLRIAAVTGDHSLRSGALAVAEATHEFLADVLT